MKFDRFVAGRYLKAKRKQAFIGTISLITLLGITLGTAALNIALSIHNGMRRAFVQSLVGETGRLYVLAGGISGGFDAGDVSAVGRLLEQVEGVHAVSLVHHEPGIVISQRRRISYAKFNGVVPDEHEKADDVFRQMVEGSPELLKRRGEQDLPGVIIGADMARDIGVRFGDEVRIAVARLASPGLSTGRRGLKLKEMKCRVAGIFKTGNSQYDTTDAYLFLDDLLMLVNTAEVGSVLVSFESIEAMEKGKAVLQGNPGLPEYAQVYDLRDLNQNLLKALKLEKLATTSVITLFILIVALNMISALTMLVMEKHRDIGIMKTFGASRNDILKIFIRQGMTLAVRGTVLGTLVGVGMALVADRFRLIRLDNSVYEVLDYLPFEVRPLEVMFVALGSLLLSFLASIYPARQASALNPVEALKFD